MDLEWMQDYILFAFVLSHLNVKCSLAIEPVELA